MSDDLPKLGRGGRGAALQQLLNSRARKPGLEAAGLALIVTTSSESATTSQSSTTSAPQPARAYGRGLALQLLRERKQMESGVGGGDGGTGVKQEGAVGGAKYGSGDVRDDESRGACGGVPLQVPQRPMGRGKFPTTGKEGGVLFGLVPELASALPEVKKSSTTSAPTIAAPRLEPMTFESVAERPLPIIQKGTSGDRIQLYANYIALRCKTEGVFQYFVSFDPIIDCKSMRGRMVHQHENVLGDTMAFDGMVLFLPKRLGNDPTLLKSVRNTDGVEVTISVKLVKILAPHECVQLYNIIFRKIMYKLDMCAIGRNYYLPSGTVKLPKEKLEVWPGYVTSCAEYEGGVMLLTDVSHRVLRSQTAFELMVEIMMNDQGNARGDISKMLVGCVVLTRYNNKCYRVDDINWNMTPTSTFDLYNGEKMTFVEYYKKMYNITVQDAQQPLLLSVPKKRQIRDDRKDARKTPEMICLVPELCYITGLTDSLRSDQRVMKELANHTRLNPSQRKASLKKFCTEVNQVPEARRELERWGFELDSDIMELEGRLMPSEKIFFGGNKECDAGPEADWSRAACRNQVITPVNLENWIILATKRDDSNVNNFVKMYIQCSRDMGIKVNYPTFISLDNDRTETYLRELKRNMNQRTQLVVTVFPFQREDRYNSIKQVCCHDSPIPSQVINSRTISDQRKLRSVTQKIALQINCKLGGELWSLRIPAKSLMVCGVDVTHDPARRSSSVVGFVSSINQQFTRWYSKVCIQEAGEELINGLKICFIDALRKFYEVNHEFPSRVVIYRDGVGDGQLSVIRDYEVQQLKECFCNFKDLQYEPKLAVIVVQKRINARLLAKSMYKPDFENPRPGTIVDHTITRRDWYDFFLVSQHIRQGTVSPTHYVVVIDELGWKTDIVQALTYKLTHLYYNWPGTVRVPAPCQYAHKLAFLIGQNVKKMPDEQLNDRLYYL